MNATQHIDVNNTAPTPIGAMSPTERRLALQKEKLAKQDRETKKAEKKKAAPTPVKKAEKSEKKAKPAKKESTSKADASGKVELKTICKKLNIDPKNARRILRKSELDFHNEKDRWTFTEKQAEKVTALLSK